MKTFEELITDEDKEKGVDEPDTVKSTDELAEEVNENIEGLEDLIEEDFNFRFELRAEKYKNMIGIFSDNVLEDIEDGEENLAKLMFKKLTFDAFGEDVKEHSKDKKILTVVPRVAFENFEKGSFYQVIGEKITYYYNFVDKTWSRNMI